MFNPFERFQPRLIAAFLKAGKRYLVSQSFAHQSMDSANNKEYLLFTQYDEGSYAQIHLSALRDDPFAAIIDLNNEKHKSKIMQMLHPDSKYVIYSSLISSRDQVEKGMNAKYKNQIRRYIEKYTNWRISSNKTIQPQLDIAFGELFIILKYGDQQIRFKVEDLEKI
jgi:hypothetical protein